MPKDAKLGEWALKLAIERAERQKLSDTAAAFIRTLLSLLVSTMPLVISWGTLVLLVANNTPVFQFLTRPFTWMLELMRIPEAGEVGVAFILSYADQFLAAVYRRAHECRGGRERRPGHGIDTGAAGGA